MNFKQLSIILFVCALAALLGLSACSDMSSSENENSNPLSIINSGFLQGGGEKASPDYQLKLPEDHQSHEAFDIEWWYFTTNLESETNEKFAFQWTLFRFRNPSTDGHTYMAHASLHTQDQHWFVEKFSDSRAQTAGIKTAPYTLFADNWQWQGTENNLLPAQLEVKWLSEGGEEISVELSLNATGPFILHGDNGYSRKTANKSHASHYYSQPFIDVSGSVSVSGSASNDSLSADVTGVGWYDHEWSSQLTEEDTQGWDWFSIHFDNGDKLMLFRMRVTNRYYETGTYITADGNSTAIQPEEIELSVLDEQAVRSKQVPTKWQIQIANHSIDIVVTVDKADAFNKGLIEYYEGPTQITGTHQGVGFLELTGY